MSVVKKIGAGMRDTNVRRTKNPHMLIFIALSNFALTRVEPYLLILFARMYHRTRFFALLFFSHAEHIDRELEPQQVCAALFGLAANCIFQSWALAYSKNRNEYAAYEGKCQTISLPPRACGMGETPSQVLE
jgi:hypothetical protein